MLPLRHLRAAARNHVVADSAGFLTGA